ncbi:MAG: nuclear transport factor 2 family protein [Deltaproteobacteria bacterium]|nr:nuclear transport factor 2 family protein [Deltaproteobacteria bacterium]
MAKKPLKKKAAKKTAPARKPKAAARRKPTPKPARKSAARAAKPRPAAPAPNPVRELAQRILDLTITHNDEASFALYADNVESIEPGMPPVTGIDAIKQKFAMWRAMVSDSSWKARNVWVDGNTIVIEWDCRATFAATGRQSEFSEVAIHEVRDGKITRERFYYDRSAMQP